MKQKIEIEVPDGKKAIWKDGKIVFEDIKPTLPKTWEEFCKQNNINKNKEEAFIHTSGEIETIKKVNTQRIVDYDKNVTFHIIKTCPCCNEHNIEVRVIEID